MTDEENKPKTLNKPYVLFEFTETDDGQVEIDLSRSEGVGSEYVQAYVKMAASVLEKHMELNLPPENVGFAIIRVEKVGDKIHLTKMATSGSDGKFRNVVANLAGYLLDMAAKGNKKHKGKRWGLF